MAVSYSSNRKPIHMVFQGTGWWVWMTGTLFNLSNYRYTLALGPKHKSISKSSPTASGHKEWDRVALWTVHDSICSNPCNASIGTHVLDWRMLITEVKWKSLHRVWLFATPRTIHGILQARILEWVAFPFSRGSSQPRDGTQVSCIASRFFTSWAIRETW